MHSLHLPLTAARRLINPPPLEKRKRPYAITLAVSITSGNHSAVLRCSIGNPAQIQREKPFSTRARVGPTIHVCLSFVIARRIKATRSQMIWRSYRIPSGSSDGQCRVCSYRRYAHAREYVHNGKSVTARHYRFNHWRIVHHGYPPV